MTMFVAARQEKCKLKYRRLFLQTAGAQDVWPQVMNASGRRVGRNRAFGQAACRPENAFGDILSACYYMVGNVRFELTAFGFGGQRSIQLS